MIQMDEVTLKTSPIRASSSVWNVVLALPNPRLLLLHTWGVARCDT